MKQITTSFFVIFLCQNLFGQFWIPKERFGKGQYWETDAYNFQNYPYTIFNHASNLSIAKQKENLIELIKTDKDKIPVGEFYRIYKALWDFAWESRPAVGGNPSAAPSRLPMWAKAHAFICYLGINPDGNTLTNNEFETLAWTAEKALLDMNTEVDWWKYAQLLGRSRELIASVQAYDLLKACGRLQNDRNKSDLTPRDNIRKLARNIFNEANDIEGVLQNPYGWKKNHGISTAAALGIAAIVLNECGAGNLYDGWKADNWARLAHWGMVECLFDAGVASLSKRGGIHSFSEGPGYFEYSMLETAVPFFIAFRNFVPANHNTWKFPYGRGGLGANNIKNYMYDKDIQNIFEWHFKIQTPNGFMPTYDNTDVSPQTAMGLFNPNYNTGDTIIGLETNMDLRADYLAALGGIGEPGRMRKSNSSDLPSFTRLDDAGNIILRMNQDSIMNRHYFHMLYETGVAHDFAHFGGVHEDDDIGSFMLTVDNDQLAIDPGYLLWSNVNKTNKITHHNVIIFDNQPSMINHYSLGGLNFVSLPTKSISNTISKTNFQSFDLKIEYNPFNPILPLTKPTFTRKVNQIKLSNGVIYYILIDYAKGNNETNNIKWQLNGNGNIEESFLSNNDLKTFTLDTVGNNRNFKWLHPCSGYKKSGGWNLYTHLSVLDGQSNKPLISTLTDDSEDGTCHSNENLSSNSNYRDDQVTQKLGTNTHTRIIATQNTNKTIFQSVLIPYKCDKESDLPIINKIEETNKIITTIKFPGLKDTSFTAGLFKSNPTFPNTNIINDTFIHLHYSRWDGMVTDSVINPFNLNGQSNNWLFLNAENSFIKYSFDSKINAGFKYCPPSYINLIYANIKNGSYIKYKDTFLIESSIPVNADIEFSGRFSYYASVKPLSVPNDLDSIRFYLADVGKGVDMVALDFLTRNELGCRYDSFSNTIAIKIPANFTNIIIEQRDKCNDCYFPPSWKGIDTLFTIDDGLIHTLGHKLSVKPDFGNLHLSNGSRLDMCPEVYLRNRDTIIIEGPAQTKEMILPNCYGIDSLKAVSSTSAIIVKSGSALVLDSGSFTYVKNGGAIYVKQNGSLVIKNGAFVQIGDSGSLGWGEIIAEQGAFIHIEPLAHIEYKSTIGDTIDRNLFVLGGGNNNAAFAGVYYLIDTILKLDTVLPIHYTSVDICALDTINPVKNKYWGYTNFAMPLATFSSRNDTLCPREPLHIKLNRILNDAQAQIKVCRMDSMLLTDRNGGTYWQDTCIEDSIIVDLFAPDPVCNPPRLMPDEWTYYFKPNSLNRVTISAINDCGMRHDTIAYIFASDTPKFYIDVPSIACEGIENIYVNVINNTYLPVKYTWEIFEEIDTTKIFNEQSKSKRHFSNSFIGIVPDSFNFPGFYFKGNKKYSIILTVNNSCLSTSSSGLLNIPVSAEIELSRPTVYAAPINGATSFQLNGYITIADSFRWEPVTWLNRADTNVVISTPEDAINYVLIAKYGGCTSTDTAFIKYNRVANAGLNDTLCFTNDTALLGNSYDMSIFLGWLYYLGGNEFRDMFMHYTGNQIDYFRYFTHFMMHEEKLQQWASFCPAEIVKTYNNQINRRVIFNLPWFKNYYASFTAFNDANIDAFDYFKTQIETDAGLMANLSGYVNWPVVQDCVNEMFYFYDDFLNNHLQEISSTWIKVSQNDTTVLTAWDEYFVAIDNPQQTSIYIQTVITPQYAEIDEVTVFRDTILAPLFYPAMQFDSTVYFANLTSPFSAASSYSWNFGDGSPLDNNPFPIHTFPAFDSSYIVCLTAFNKCGSFMYCDTIRIDSASLSNQRVVYNNSRPGLSNQADYALKSDRKVKGFISRAEIFLTNYPNPFNDKTIIDYQIWQPFSNASLIVTNTLGQVVYDQKLIKPIDKVSLDGNLFSNGLYYYSIVIDNSTKLTKMMSVMH